MATSTASLLGPSVPMLPVAMASLAASVLALGMPLVVLQIYDRILPRQSVETLAILTAGLLVVFILDAIIRLARMRLLDWVGAQYEHRASCQLTDGLLQADLATIPDEGIGTHRNRLAAISTIRQVTCGPGATALFELPVAMVALTLMAIIGGAIIAVPLAIIAVSGLLILQLGRRSRQLLEERQGLDARRQNFLAQLFSQIHTVKALSLEQQMLRRYQKVSEGQILPFRGTMQTQNLISTVVEAAAQFCVVVVGLAAAWLVVRGTMTAGEMAATMLLSSRSIQPVFQALGFLSQRERAGAARALLQAVPPIERPGAEVTAGEIVGRVAFRDLGYMRPKEGRWLFRNVDLEIAAGEIIGISGADGSGKSAFLRLCSGRWAPAEGQVLIDDVPVADRDRDSLFRQVVLVDDQPVMFEGSIIENLTMFNQVEAHLPHAALIDVLGIGGMVAKLAAGFETRLGAGADDVSNDLRQRIAIARAILQRPRILLLDEADSNLDLDGSQQLMALLGKLKGALTIVMVSQRPSILRIADRRFHLADGQLELVSGPEEKPQHALAPASAITAGAPPSGAPG